MALENKKLSEFTAATAVDADSNFVGFQVVGGDKTNTYYTLAQLAAAISGSTPTLQQVTDSGNNTTDNIIVYIDGGIKHLIQPDGAYIQTNAGLSYSAIYTDGTQGIAYLGSPDLTKGVSVVTANTLGDNRTQILQDKNGTVLLDSNFVSGTAQLVNGVFSTTIPAIGIDWIFTCNHLNIGSSTNIGTLNISPGSLHSLNITSLKTNGTTETNDNSIVQYIGIKLP